MEILLPIIALIWVILNIVLFFKVWRACDDIRRIADKYDPDGKAAREQAKAEAERKAHDAFIDK